MSIQYNKEIFSNDTITLQINFLGINDGIASVDNLEMSFYAYDKINGNPIFSAIFSFEQINYLYQHLNQISIIKESTKDTSSKFIETSSQIQLILDSLKGNNSEAIKSILKFISLNSNKNDIIEILLKSLSQLNLLEDLPAAHKHKTYKQELDNLKTLLELETDNNIVSALKELPHLNNYKAGQPEAIFQNWIERNILWVFGVEYKNHKYKARKISIFSEADLVMESMDGYIDLIELKRPIFNILNRDKSHNSYYPSVDLSKALGQCGHYLKKMDEYKLQLQNEHKIKILRPRVKIIIGRTNEYTEDQYESLRLLNSNLNNIQIISYDYLLDCGQHIISNYK